MDLQGEKQAFAFKKSSAGYFNPYFKKATSAGLSTLTTLTVSTSDTISVASGRECLQRIILSGKSIHLHANLEISQYLKIMFFPQTRIMFS